MFPLSLVKLVILFLFCFREHILAYSAKGADEIVGKILEFSTGGNSVLGIAESLIIFPAANITYVLHIILISFGYNYFDHSTSEGAEYTLAASS